ncbi:MAG TPA: thioredoxin [Spirillospora sp.]|nr:thioredoxin [Spirillospora sp.]
MPVFDTPITTDDNNLKKVLGQKLPVVLYLYDRPNPALDEAFSRVAREHAGEILVTRVDVTRNPQTHARYNRPQLPALLTLDEGEIESRAENIRPADVDAHVDFLLGLGPKPLETAAQAESRAASGAAPIPVTDASFEQDVLQSSVPVLVDFWAPWCGPCHMIAPVLDRLAQQYAGRIKIAKLNVDENLMTARRYQAMSIPMLLLFKDGQPVGKLVGAHPQPKIEQLIRQVL